MSNRNTEKGVKHVQSLVDVVLVSLLLARNIFYNFSSIHIVHFEKINVYWARAEIFGFKWNYISPDTLIKTFCRIDIYKILMNLQDTLHYLKTWIQGLQVDTKKILNKNLFVILRLEMKVKHSKIIILKISHLKNRISLFLADANLKNRIKWRQDSSKKLSYRKVAFLLLENLLKNELHQKNFHARKS